MHILEVLGDDLDVKRELRELRLPLLVGIFFEKGLQLRDVLFEAKDVSGDRANRPDDTLVFVHCILQQVVAANLLPLLTD